MDQDLKALQEQEEKQEVLNALSNVEADRARSDEIRANQAQKQQADIERTQASQNEDGTAKTQYEAKDPKKFGAAENIQEAANAVTAGLQDAWNNTIDLGKLFDPEFYKERTEGQDPYKFASPLKFNDQPLVRTGWGKLIRGVTDVGIGWVGLGKFGMAVKGIRGLSAAAKTANVVEKGTKGVKAGQIARTIGTGAAKGAVVDAWDSDSMDSNIARTLIDVNPDWADTLEVIATKDYMSPAQKTLYNMAEGIALGGIIDLAFEGAGVGRRLLSDKKEKALAKAKAETNKQRVKEGLKPIDEAYPTPMTAVNNNVDLDYKGRTQLITDEARIKYERDQFQSLKKNGFIDPDMSIDEFRQSYKAPSMDEIDTMAILRNGFSTPEMVDELASKIKPSWDELDDVTRGAYVEKQALDMDVDFGDTRDYSRRAAKQGKEVENIGIDQFQEDLDFGQPRQNPYYAEGAAAHENAPLTADSDVIGAVRDQVTIRNDWRSKYGANRGVISEAATRRIANQSKLGADQIDKIAEGLVDNESFKHLYGSTSKQQMRDDFVDAAADLQSYLDITGNSHAADLTSENMMEFLYSITPKLEMDRIEGVPVLSHRQLVATDVVLGQMAEQIRDLSKAGLSISKEVNTTAAGNVIDPIADRFKALARMRARTSALASYKLRQFRSPDSAPIKNVDKIIEEAENEAAGRIDLLKEVIQNDNESGDLFEAFQYVMSASNGKLSTMKDMEEFFHRKLYGYKDGTTVEKNAIVNEMMTMGINSMLSGPKTAVRATFGTAFNTFMRPVSAIVGGSLSGDSRTVRESFAFLSGMWEARGEAMRKAVADFKTYMSVDNPESFRSAIAQQKNAQFEAMEKFYAANGTAGEKAYMQLASTMRGLNHNPFLTYGPRVMKASDMFFGQMIGRGMERVRQYQRMYDDTASSMVAVDDVNIRQMGIDAETMVEKNIWTADGKLADSMANFTWDEAALKGELTGGFKKLDQAFDSFPAIKPFVGLFMKTGVNALELTAKYTPFLNKVLKEDSDIMTRAWDDPELLKYGIQSPQDLAHAQAVLKGRQAIGMGIVGAASVAYLNGDITGNGPPDRKLRNAWMQAGWKPRSIRLGDVYVSYDSLEPFNAFLSTVADIGDASNAMGEEWTNNTYSKLMHVISANVTNKTFLAGLMNLNDLLSSKGQRAGSVAANLINNQVPLSSLRNEIGKVLAPGMREIEAGLVDGIRNRNLWTDVLTDKDAELPYRYDILNGSKINDWDPMTRLWNATSPFQINLAANQTRQLLFRSQINLAQQFNSGPNGEDLEGKTGLKSRFQYLMGQQNIEGQLTELFKNPQITQSILDMEADRDAGRKYKTTGTLHGVEIMRIINGAKQVAWQQLMQEDSRAAILQQQQAVSAAAQQQRQAGDNTRANQISDLLSLPK